MAARKWSPEQRAAQSAAIKTWQPWHKSTGAKSAAGKAKVSLNAYRGAKRPFLRLINTVYRAYIRQGAEVSTLVYWDKINAAMDDICRNDEMFFSKKLNR